MEVLLDVLRQEKKYLLNPLDTARARALMEAVLHKDNFSAGGKGYIVRSLYFDTLDNKDFIEKSDGIADRKKIRLRIYDTKQQTAKLELKEKEGAFQRKRSLTISRNEAEEMSLGNYGCLTKYDNPFAWEMYGRMQEQFYRPCCMVEYDRIAFMVAENDIRVTLDSEIRATEGCYDLFSKQLLLYPVSAIGATTLEVKYNRFLLSYIKDLLIQYDTMQVSASKYCMARNISMRGSE